MCKKNDYARRAITALLAVLAALLVLSSMTSARTTISVRPKLEKNIAAPLYNDGGGRGSPAAVREL